MDRPSSPPPAPGPAVSPAGLIATTIRRPVAVTMMVLAVAVFGLVSVGKLPVTLLPDVSYPTLTVRTEYEGAAPADIEKLITRRVEETLAVVSNLVNYRSISRAGVSDIILEFEWKTPMTFAAQDVREKVDQVLPRLPEGTKRPLILRYDPALDPVMRIALSSEGDQDLAKLRETAEEDIRRKLENIPGVAAVRPRGGFEEEWRIELREDLLKLHGISADAVKQRVQTENANVAGGILRDGDRESLVRTLGEITEPAELRQLVVAVQGGRPVRIEELGDVIVDHRERDVVTRSDGRESVEIEIYKEAGANAVAVCQAVKTRLYGTEWRKRLVNGVYTPRGDEDRPESGPEASGGPGKKDEGPLAGRRDRTLADTLLASGVRTRVLSDQSVFIEKSIDDVKLAAIQGAVLAVAILYLFLRRIGPTLIIGVSIPVSILATFGPLYVAGISLNIMSLGGLALGVGMLVDASIVVLDVITRRRDEGQDFVASAIDGTREVAAAVTSSVLTTVAVFLPIVFVEGVAGEFFRDQAVVVVFSLMASLVASIFFIPMLSARRFGSGGGRSDRAAARARVLALAPWMFPTYVAVRNLDRAASAWSRGLLRGLASVPVMLFEAAFRLPLELAARTAFSAAVLVVALVMGTVYVLARGLGFAVRPLLWAFDRGYLGVEASVRGLLRGALRARLLVVLAAGALCWWAATRIPGLGVELMPEVHQGEFTIESQLAVGTPVERTDDVCVAVTEAVRRALDSESIALAGISSAAGVDRNVIAKAGDGKHTARVHVLLGASERLAEAEERAIGAIRREMASIPDVRDPVFTRPSIFTTRTALEIEVVGDDLDRIRSAASLVEESMRQIEGLTDVQSTWRPGHPELVVRPDREQLARYDLTAGGVAGLLRDKVQGAVSTRVSRGDRKVEVLVRAPRGEVAERDSLLALRVNPGAARPIPLSVVATVDQQPGPAEIRRVAGERAIVLSAVAANLDLGGAARRIEADVAGLRAEHPEAFREINLRIAGQREESERSLDSLLFALAIATFLVYLIMAAQFESLHHPLVILLTIPLSLVGVTFTLEALAIKISIVVLLGGILLVGIVVNNAIVMIDCVNQRRRAGVGRDAALVESVRLRLRPILMTTLTTVLGLLPLALGSGEGEEVQTPMAVTVIAGLASSTVLTLVVIPVVYSLVTRSGPIRSREDSA